MLKAALVSTAVAQHLLRNHLGVLPCLFIPGKFTAIRLGDRFPSAHDNIEKYNGILEEYRTNQKVA
jgi:hypothetical protein